MITTLFTAIYDLMHKNDHLVCIGSAVHNVEFEKFLSDFPSRFIDSSHKETTVLSLCMALLNKNKAVIVCVPMPQFVTRWYEQIVNDLGYKTFQIIIIGLPSNSLPWGSFRPELALAQTIPNLSILAPATKQECSALLFSAFLARRPFYIHLNTLQPVSLEPKNKELPALFEPFTYAQGSQIACIGIGSALEAAHIVKTNLEAYGYSASTISIHTLKPLKKEPLLRILHTYSAIFVFDELDSPLEFGKILGAFFLENALKQIVFKSFAPVHDSENETSVQANQYPNKKLNLRTCTLEIVETLIRSNIIPTHPSWNKN
ncbi:hypothetical protein FJ366_02355 [Candidatus Dependentiae bacterium]|nr:hypothetical protein [Candidatus Dependentiae bacterium]